MMTSLKSETRRYRTTLAVALVCVGLALGGAVAVVAAGVPQWAPPIIAVGMAPLPMLIHAQLRLGSAHTRRHAHEAADQVARRVAEVTRGVDQVSQSLTDTRNEIRTAEARLSLGTTQARHDALQAAERHHAGIDEVSRELRDTRDALRTTEARLAQQGQHTHETLVEGLDRVHRSGLVPALDALTRGHRDLAEQIDGVGKQVSSETADTRREIISVESRLLREWDATAALLREVTAGIDAEVTALGEGMSAERTELAGRLRRLSKRLKVMQESTATITRKVEGGFLATRVSLEQMPHTVAQYQAVREAVAPGRLDLPMLGGWVITAPVVSFIAGRLLMSEEPLTVLELGSGASTLWSAMAIARVGRGRCVSLDHDERFAAKTAALLADHGVSEHAQVVHAPLTDVELDGRTYPYYDLSVLPDDVRVDILLVDGPPAVPHQDTRFPALPLLFDRLNPNAQIVIDDTIRIDEKNAIRAWQERYPMLEWQADLGKATLLTLGQSHRD